MIWTVPISSKGQVTLPIKLRRKLNVDAGKDKLLIQEEGSRGFFRPLSSLDMRDLYGIVRVKGKKPVDVEAEIRRAKRVMARRVLKEGL